MTIIAVTYRYADDVAARDRVLPEHRAYLRALADQGVLLVSGPYGPGEPRGALLLFHADKARVTALIADDPFTTNGVIAITEITAWEPVIGPLVPAIQSRPVARSAVSTAGSSCLSPERKLP
jgi:uncharacterized protein YciI